MNEQGFGISVDLLNRLQSSCLSIDGGGVKTLYSDGFEKKAICVQKLMDEAISFYKKELDVNLDLVLFVSNEEDYYSFFQGPYGVPFIEEEHLPHLVLMPCEAGAVLKGALAVEEKLTIEFQKKAQVIGYNYKDMASTYVDLIALHEIGHAVLLQLGIGQINHWFNELMATYIAYSYMKAIYPVYGEIYMLMSQLFFREPNSFQRKELVVFDKEYDQIPLEDPANYDWYQKRLNLMVKDIYDVYGLSFIEDVVRDFRGKVWTHEETLAQMKETNPQVHQWISQF